jgi:hypothetical protein
MIDGFKIRQNLLFYANVVFGVFGFGFLNYPSLVRAGCGA